MKFEINVKNNEKLQKLALVKKIARVLGMYMFAAKVSIADKIFELFKDGVESTSFVVDSEITKMSPLFSIQKDMPLFQDEQLRYQHLIMLYQYLPMISTRSLLR